MTRGSQRETDRLRSAKRNEKSKGSEGGGKQNVKESQAEAMRKKQKAVFFVCLPFFRYVMFISPLVLFKADDRKVAETQSGAPTAKSVSTLSEEQARRKLLAENKAAAVLNACTRAYLHVL